MKNKIPLYEVVEKYANSKPTIFHMPGHKMGKKVEKYYSRDIINWDVTEIPGMDDLHCPEGAIAKAQNLAAEAFGAEQTFFLVNGSTGGLHALLMTIGGKGKKIIIGIDSHKSVINILTLMEMEVVFVKPSMVEEYGITGGYNPEDIRKVLNENIDCVAVMLTSPNYYGICSKLEEISEIVHSYNKILLIDEAHGAHLKFGRQLPENSLEQGADACVQSAHKTLPALTQTAYLHIKSNRIDKDKLKNILGIIQTSSPSYIFMVSLDIARYIMHTEGEKELDYICKLIDEFIKKVDKIKGVKILSSNNIEYGEHDKTRLVMNFNDLGISGYTVGEILREEYNIQVEMADLYNIVCISTISDTEENFKKLENAVCQISKKYASQSKKNDKDLQKIKRDVYIDKRCGRHIKLKNVLDYNKELVKLKDSEGKISYRMIIPYPPGIPVVISGQKISKNDIEYLMSIIKSGGNVVGINKMNEIEIIKNKY